MSGLNADTPCVSIIIAAYGRPEVLRWSIMSVLAQTHTDWELLVVSDSCEATSRLMREVTRFNADDRIRHYNLSINVGEQSGPNNYGVSLARGRYIAFLNQDDLWFPDHLQVSLDAIQAYGAGIVFSLAGSMVQMSREDLLNGRWLGGLNGVSQYGGYDPVTTFAPASAWLVRREVANEVGPWRSASEYLAAPSQDFLFRAWRAGVRIRSTTELTVLTFSSGGRPGSYVSDTSFEQRWWFEEVGLNTVSRAALLHRLSIIVPRPPCWICPRILLSARNHLLRFLAMLGIDPKPLLHGYHGRWRKGGYVDWLRRIRGLEQVFRGHLVDRAHRRAVNASCEYTLGQRIDFSTLGNSHRYQLRGWAFPEQWGTWTEGAKASMKLKMTSPIPPHVMLRMEARAYGATNARPRGIRVTANERIVLDATLSMPDFSIIELALEYSDFTKDGLLSLSFNLPDCISPHKLIGSSDCRRLGLGVRALWLQ